MRPGISPASFSIRIPASEVELRLMLGWTITDAPVCGDVVMMPPISHRVPRHNKKIPADRLASMAGKNFIGNEIDKANKRLVQER